jgi:hypothetical protein
MEEEKVSRNDDVVGTEMVHISQGLVRFFDLLAQFDHNDKQKNVPSPQSDAIPHDHP